MRSKKAMRQKLFFIHRFLGLFLSASLALPHPAFALRSLQPKQNVGLEENLARSLTDQLPTGLEEASVWVKRFKQKLLSKKQGLKRFYPSLSDRSMVVGITPVPLALMEVMMNLNLAENQFEAGETWKGLDYLHQVREGLTGTLEATKQQLVRNPRERKQRDRLRERIPLLSTELDQLIQELTPPSPALKKFNPEISSASPSTSGSSPLGTGLEEGFSRRDFLKGSAAVAISQGLPAQKDAQVPQQRAEEIPDQGWLSDNLTQFMEKFLAEHPPNDAPFWPNGFAVVDGQWVFSTFFHVSEDGIPPGHPARVAVSRQREAQIRKWVDEAAQRQGQIWKLGVLGIMGSLNGPIGDMLSHPEKYGLQPGGANSVADEFGDNAIAILFLTRPEDKGSTVYLATKKGKILAVLKSPLIDLVKAAFEVFDPQSFRVLDGDKEAKRIWAPIRERRIREQSSAHEQQGKRLPSGLEAQPSGLEEGEEGYLRVPNPQFAWLGKERGLRLLERLLPKGGPAPIILYRGDLYPFDQFVELVRIEIKLEEGRLFGRLSSRTTKGQIPPGLEQWNELQLTDQDFFLTSPAGLVTLQHTSGGSLRVPIDAFIDIRNRQREATVEELLQLPAAGLEETSERVKRFKERLEEKAARGLAAEFWSGIAMTPAYEEKARNRLVAFAGLESSSAIPLVARGGLPFLVFTASGLEEGRIRAILDDLNVNPDQYQIRPRNGMLFFEILAGLEQEFPNHTILSADSSQPNWLQGLLAGLEDAGVIPLDDLSPALRATKDYFQFV